MVTNNTEWVREIKSLDKAVRKYVIEFEGKIYEADNVQDIIHVIDPPYIDSDDKYVQMIMRIDLARALSMYALMFGLNVEVYNGNERVKPNYAADKDDPDYEEEYEEADVIINVKNEITMFSGINKIGYAKIYYRNDKGVYELFNLGEKMENYNTILECFEKNDVPMNATAVAEKTGIDKKEVSKVMDKLKKEEKIYSPKRCYWQIKRG